MKNTKLKVYDLKKFTNEYKRGFNAESRYASFDYCYQYFQENSASYIAKNLENSCLMIGFYLASWGMLRGSSFLLDKSSFYYKNLVNLVVDTKRNNEILWEIEPNQYDEYSDEILGLYQGIKDVFVHSDKSKKCPAHLTITTKIMLGVFGVIPAFDRFFRLTMKKIDNIDCGFSSVSKYSLSRIQTFYLANQADIDILAKETRITSFATGNTIEGFFYPKAKIIDMYGFTKGMILDDL